MRRLSLTLVLLTVSIALAAPPPPPPPPPRPPGGAPPAPPPGQPPAPPPAGRPAPPPPAGRPAPPPPAAASAVVTAPPPAAAAKAPVFKGKKIVAKLSCSVGEGAAKVKLPSKLNPRLEQAVFCSVTSKDERLLKGRGLFQTKWTSYESGSPQPKVGEERSAEPGSEGASYFYQFTLDPGRDTEACSGDVDLLFHVSDLDGATSFSTKATFKQDCPD